MRKYAVGVSETRWWKYIAPVIGNMTMRDAAQKAGFNQSAFTRWKNGAKADPEFVVKFARAFDLNVLQALVEAELISQNEADLREVHIGGVNLTDASPRQLAEEFLRRMNDAESQLLESTDAAPRASVSSLHDRDQLVERINAGLEPVAAQETTEPLEENQP
ncbi:hypothetical protein AWU68_1343 [Corynebacterium simulans]|nr:hypothetical protein AWU68_1343 [Corynebacterium simulans]